MTGPVDHVDAADLDVAAGRLDECPGCGDFHDPGDRAGHDDCLTQVPNPNYQKREHHA